MVFRNSMLVALTLPINCVLVTPANSLSFDQKITYKCAAITVKAAFEEIAKRTGLNLSTSTAIGSEPLIIKATDVKLQDLLDRIAIAVDGNWLLEKGGVRRLVANKKPPKAVGPDPGILENMKMAQAKVRAEMTKDSSFDAKIAQALVLQIEEHLRAVTANPNDPKAWMKRESIAQQSPAGLLARRIFVELDPKLLASVPRNGRVVLSMRPNKLQLHLPEQASFSVRQFETEFSIWKQAVGNRVFNYAEFSPAPTNFQFMLQKNSAWSPGIAEPESLSKLLVVLTANSGEGTSRLELKLADQLGIYAATYAHLIDSASLAAGNQLIFKSEPNEKDLVLSDISIEYAKRVAALIGGRTDPDNPNPPTPGLEQVMLSPEKTDPLSFAIPEAIFQLSDHSKKSIVACPQDYNTIFFVQQAAQGSMKPSRFIDTITSPAIGVKVVVEPDWIVVCSPATGIRVAPTFMNRTDRSLIGKALRSVKTNGLLTIEMAAEVAYADKNFESNALSRTFYDVGFYRPDLWSEININTSFSRQLSFLRLYGSLDIMQKRMLLDGQRLPIKDLRPDQKQIVGTIPKNGPIGLTFRPKLPSNPDEIRAFYFGIRSETTERWPNGFPPSASIGISDSQEQIVLISHSNARIPKRLTQTAMELGETFAYPDMPEYIGDDYVPPHFESFRLGNQRTVKIQVQFDNEVSIEGELKESRYSGLRVDSFENLPADFKAKVMAAKAKAIEDYKKRKPPTANSKAPSHEPMPRQ